MTQLWAFITFPSERLHELLAETACDFGGLLALCSHNGTALHMSPDSSPIFAVMTGTTNARAYAYMWVVAAGAFLSSRQ